MPARMTYREIANDLADRIGRGEYPPGSMLPTYVELGEIYSVHKETAGRAIAILKDRGLVTGHQGVGVFVVDAPPPSG